MPSLRDCIGKAGKLLSPADGDAMHARAKKYLGDGHSVQDAERMAVEHAVSEAHGHLDSIYKQAGVERPKAGAKPKEKKEAQPEPSENKNTGAVKFTVQQPGKSEGGHAYPGFVSAEKSTAGGRGEPLTAEERAQHPTDKEIIASGLHGSFTPEQVREAIAKKSDSGKSDYDKYQDLQKKWESIPKEKRGLDNPEIKELFKQNEEIKNRHGGMPPEPPSKEEKSDAIQKPIASSAPVRQAPENSEGVRGGNAVDQGTPAARQSETAKGEEPVRPEVAAENKAETKPAPKVETASKPKVEPEAKPVAETGEKKPPSWMKPAERVAELEAAGVKEINGKPIAEANSAEIINAVGKLRRGQLGITDEPKPVSERLIDALNKAKINKPGSGKVLSADPLSLAYDGALDLAIIGVKAGRGLAHMIELAVKRFRAAYPKATKADEQRLEAAIRSAHAEATALPDAGTPAEKAEAKIEKKVSSVISSPQAEETRSKIAKAWNDAREGANLKETLASTNEAAENQAKATAREAYTTVFNELKRTVGKKEIGIAADAIGFRIEAGQEKGKTRLKEMRKQIEESTKADPKWKARATAAIDYAIDNYDKLKKPAELYRGFTDAQAVREQAAGMPTLKRDNYVMHAQDIDDGTWIDKALGAGGSGMSPTGASNRKNRVFDTHADSIAAGTNPKTLNALELLQRRISAGETGVNLRQWQQSLHNYIDAKTKQPIAMKPERVERADGSYYYQAPKGYKLEMLGNTPVAVKKEYRGIISDLTDPSWWSKSENRKMVQKLNATGKSINLLIDTFHLGRLAIQQSILKSASLTDMRVPRPSFKEGLNILDHSPDEMRKMAKNGEISPESLPDLLDKKKNLGILTAAGLNTGHIADSMHQEFVRSIPGIGDINKFIFEKFQRGAMAESALMEFERQKKSYSDLTPQEVAKQVARDINTRFGNLGKQGWFKSRSMQDMTRLIALAPQWNEGLIKSEIGGVRQIGQSIVDAATGKRFAMGALGRDMIAGTLGIFVANQIINQMTRGKFTWENPEEEWGAKLSAWIPDKVGGKSSGFFLNPLGVTAEISHLLLTRYERTGNSWAPIVDFARSRASALARPAWTFFLGKSGLGGNIKPSEIYKETLKSAVPAPIGASSAVSAVRGAVTGGNTEVYPGQFQKQAMQSFGVKTDTAPSPEQRISALAREFNRTKKIEPAAEFYAGDYTDLIAALRRNNPSDIKTELQSLMEKKTHDEIAKHFKSWGAHPFTGQKGRETEFIRTLNSEQRAAYVRAQRSRLELGQRAIQAISRMPPQLQRTGTD